ncbi:MAG: glycosyltransferase [Alphaproteobacteria bacterium]|nr:glycosyltransferase [Alphaproteobacteria bacterium]
MSGPGLHVLVVNVFFAPHTYGGATIVAEAVAGHLRRDHGVTVSAISVMSRADLAPYAVLRAERDGVVNHLINLPPGRSYAEHYRNPRVAERIAMLTRQLAPDIAHVHCVQEIGADAIGAIRGAGVPVILSVHDFWWLCERQFMLRPDGRYCGQHPIRIEDCRGCVDDFARAQARFEAFGAAAGAAVCVTYPSRFARALCEASGLAPGRGVVWSNGVRAPGPDFAALQAARRARDPRPVFGFVGGPSAMKGWPLIQSAFSGAGRSDFRGLLVDGSMDGSWWTGRNIAALRGDWAVCPRFDQAGMDAFYAEIDVLLFLSQWKETFGLTIREALARGIRVIQTDSGGTMEHGVREGVEVVPMGCDPAILRGAVDRMLDDPSPMAPVAMHDVGAQAREFLGLAQRVLGADAKVPGAA